jgi:hypothetical protein
MTEAFKFHHLVYEMVFIVEGSAKESFTIMEINWESPDVVQKLCRFSKDSILHQYIYSIIAVYFRRDYRKNADLYEQSDIAEIEATFREYGIKLRPFEAFYKKKGIGFEGLDKAFYEWFCEQEDQFAKLWEAITDEVFHLLFANRRFLLNFNQSLANCLGDGEISIPSDCQGENGHIKRDGYIPSWLKKAVYLRDHGRCVLCQKDLTGLISTDISLHYDHIVPLNKWGTNDPCNIQLLCDKCNLQKSSKEATTGIKYPAWW